MLVIQSNFANKMIDHAVLENPNECCGILVGESDEIRHIYPITNIRKSPYSYVMDPQEQLDAMIESDQKGWEFLAFYHSHTHSPAYPSTTDVRMALRSGWLDVYYVLISLEKQGTPELRAFHISESGIISEDNIQTD